MSRVIPRPRAPHPVENTRGDLVRDLFGAVIATLSLLAFVAIMALALAAWWYQA